jgi:putative addiction module component (TIGR02574 family)
MSERLKALGIDRMSIAERLVLMHEILDSIAEAQEGAQEEAPLTDAQRTELERRIAANKANPEQVIPWEQIKAEALARFQK